MFNIVKNRKLYFLISLAIIIPGMIAMLYNIITLPTHTPWRLSVDFKEGTRLVLKFNQPVSEDQLRAALAAEGMQNPSVSRLGADADNAWQVRTDFLEDARAEAVRNTISTKVAPLDLAQSSVESVGARVANEVTSAAFWAVIAAAIAVLLFIWYAFRRAQHALRYSVCAIIAMVHDILVVGGLTALACIFLGWEVDALFLTAMLTVIGFSVQDTIVVYDRIRENLIRHRGEPFGQIVTRSLVETLHRSLALSLVNIFVMVALMLFGGASIKQFVAVLLFGLVSGAYSSIFNAVPLVVAWEERSLFGRPDDSAVAVPSKA
ncbi:MAG: protein translocase subunit SecF [Thermoflexales bacterium]|nr:protein translocase subunit SecF [Thermoflexales bacterium]